MRLLVVKSFFKSGFLMKINDVLNWIIERGPRTGSYSLDRMRYLLEELKNPQREYATVIIGGTNGKGSVTSIAESILCQCEDYNIGALTSPHLMDLRERVRVKGQPVENKLWVEAVSELKEIFKLMDKEPSIGGPGFFETVTALAFLVFKEMECDLVLLEVGLGGRFDSTNTAEPEISLITNIGTDHQDMLGTGKVSIAKEKLGIIRKKRPLITTEKDPEILKVFKEATDNIKSEMIIVEREKMFTTINSCSNGHQIKTPYSDEEIFFPMPGEHQLENLALALQLIEKLKSNGFQISDEAIVTGIKTVFWPGRLQWIKKEHNTFLLDGAHNPEGLDCLLRYLKRYPPEEPLTIIFGTLEEKPASIMASRLETVGTRFIYCPPSCGRAMEPKLFLDTHSSEKEWETCTHVSQALEKIHGVKGTVLITGSLYLLSDTLKELEK